MVTWVSYLFCYLNKGVSIGNSANFINNTLLAAPNKALVSFLNGSGTGQGGSFAGLGTGNTPSVLPVFNLLIGIKNKDPIAIVQGVVGVSLKTCGYSQKSSTIRPYDADIGVKNLKNWQSKN